MAYQKLMVTLKQQPLAKVIINELDINEKVMCKHTLSFIDQKSGNLILSSSASSFAISCHDENQLELKFVKIQDLQHFMSEFIETVIQPIAPKFVEIYQTSQISNPILHKSHQRLFKQFKIVITQSNASFEVNFLIGQPLLLPISTESVLLKIYGEVDMDEELLIYQQKVDCKLQNLRMYKVQTNVQTDLVDQYVFLKQIKEYDANAQLIIKQGLHQFLVQVQLQALATEYILKQTRTIETNYDFDVIGNLNFSVTLGNDIDAYKSCPLEMLDGFNFICQIQGQDATHPFNILHNQQKVFAHIQKAFFLQVVYETSAPVLKINDPSTSEMQTLILKDMDLNSIISQDFAKFKLIYIVKELNPELHIVDDIIELPKKENSPEPKIKQIFPEPKSMQRADLCRKILDLYVMVKNAGASEPNIKPQTIEYFNCLAGQNIDFVYSLPIMLMQHFSQLELFRLTELAVRQLLVDVSTLLTYNFTNNKGEMLQLLISLHQQIAERRTLIRQLQLLKQTGALHDILPNQQEEAQMAEILNEQTFDSGVQFVNDLLSVESDIVNTACLNLDILTDTELTMKIKEQNHMFKTYFGSFIEGTSLPNFVKVLLLESFGIQLTNTQVLTHFCQFQHLLLDHLKINFIQSVHGLFNFLETATTINCVATQIAQIPKLQLQLQYQEAMIMQLQVELAPLLQQIYLSNRQHESVQNSIQSVSSTQIKMFQFF